MSMMIGDKELREVRARFRVPWLTRKYFMNHAYYAIPPQIWPKTSVVTPYGVFPQSERKISAKDIIMFYYYESIEDRFEQVNPGDVRSNRNSGLYPTGLVIPAPKKSKKQTIL